MRPCFFGLSGFSFFSHLLTSSSFALLTQNFDIQFEKFLSFFFLVFFIYSQIAFQYINAFGLLFVLFFFSKIVQYWNLQIKRKRFILLKSLWVTPLIQSHVVPGPSLTCARSGQVRSYARSYLSWLETVTLCSFVLCQDLPWWLIGGNVLLLTNSAFHRSQKIFLYYLTLNVFF